MKKTIHFILGVGEVGTAIKKILEKKADLFWYDINTEIESNLPTTKNQQIDVLHVVIPYSKSFVKTINLYKKRYQPKLIVNHSTVEIGATQKLGLNAVHSPILGQHNNLYRHIKVFKKAVGPNSEGAKKLAKKYLSGHFKLEFYSDSKTTELAKLISLSRFALQIHFAQYCEKLCKKTETRYEESYTKFAMLYNDGYKKIKQEQFVEPLLYPPSGKIGGSCVIPGVEKTQKILKDISLQEILESNKKIKVLHITSTLNAGGAEKIVFDIFRNINKDRFDPRLCILSKKENIAFFSPRELEQVLFLNKKRGFSLKVWGQLLKIVKRVKPDIVHIHSLYNLKYLLPLTFFSKFILVVTLHVDFDNAISRFNQLKYRTLIKLFRIKTINVSDKINTKFMPKATAQINNWVDPKFKAQDIRPNKHEEFQILCVARFYPQKNYRFLINEFIKFNKLFPKSHLTIIGEGRLENEILSLSKNHRSIKVLKPVINIEKIYPKFDLFVLCSKYEGLPLTVIEAMACGLPILISNFSSAHTIATDPIEIFEIDNSNDFQKKIMKIYSNQDLRNRLSILSIKKASLFDINKSLRELETFYEKIL